MKPMPESNDNYEISLRRQKHLVDVDSLPTELKKLVHEFGYSVVFSCLDKGLTKPNLIRQLIVEIWEGSREIGQTRVKRGPLASLDKLLLEAEANISADKLLQFLNNHSWAIVPMEPMPSMVNASLGEVSGYNVKCTKAEKHARRLRAAIRAGNNYLLS